MNLKKYFTTRTVVLDLHGNSKESILKELVEVLCKAGKLKEKDSELVLKALLKREKMMSTGIQDGVAIPHAKVRGVKDLIAVLAFKRDGIDFDALDGKPSNIFIMTLSPEDRPVPHVQLLAEISQRLSDARLRERLLECTSIPEVLHTFIDFHKNR